MDKWTIGLLCSPPPTITLILGHESKERIKSPSVSGCQKIGCQLSVVSPIGQELLPADSVGGGQTVIAQSDGLSVPANARLPGLASAH
jgi:hypothetical protein